MAGGGKQQLIREIKQTIERWEPRIARPIDVRFESESVDDQNESGGGILRANLTIQARLAAAPEEFCVFHTSILPNGRVEITR